MSLAATNERLTYEDWLLLPQTSQPHEIIDGVIRMSPSPLLLHQWILQNLYDLVAPFVRRGKLGHVILSPMDVVIQKEPLRTRQPDLLFISMERAGGRSRKALIALRWVSIPPDLTVEVLSESNTREEIAGKLEDYRRIGVRECWLVSPEARTVEILALGAEGVARVALLGLGDRLRSAVLPGFEADVDAIFDLE